MLCSNDFSTLGECCLLETEFSIMGRLAMSSLSSTSDRPETRKHDAVAGAAVEIEPVLKSERQVYDILFESVNFEEHGA